MPMNARALLGILLCVATSIAGAAGDHYPSKPIRLVVPFTPGGSNDLVGRVISQKLFEAWGQPVIIDNQIGRAHV